MSYPENFHDAPKLPHSGDKMVVRRIDGGAVRGGTVREFGEFREIKDSAYRL